MLIKNLCIDLISLSSCYHLDDIGSSLRVCEVRLLYIADITDRSSHFKINTRIILNVFSQMIHG